jgi:hypothetical protein
MNATKLRSIRKVIGSILFGFGLMNLFCIGLLELWWTSHGPKAPDPEHGFIFLHSEKWLIAYFSQFQVTAVGLLFYVSIPVTVLGYLIVPRKWDIAPNSRIEKYPKLTIDDPSKISRWGVPLGFIASPLAIYFIGPSFVTWLNGLGF